MNIFSWLDEIAKKQGLSFLIIGGHALGAHGYSRFTNDVDVLSGRAEVQKWSEALCAVGYIVFHESENFVQFTSEEANATPLDFMLVADATFAQMKSEAIQWPFQNVPLLVPSLGHLLALKLHSAKHGPPHRIAKDLPDIHNLVLANEIDVRSDKFRQMCEKYGDGKIYEQILALRKL